MEFELAYDLPIEVDREVVFIQCDDRNRKVRVLLSDVQSSGDKLTFNGCSLGSSVREIKAAKRDEPPVLVRGEFQSHDGEWKGSLVPA